MPELIWFIAYCAQKKIVNKFTLTKLKGSLKNVLVNIKPQLGISQSVQWLTSEHFNGTGHSLHDMQILAKEFEKRSIHQQA